MKKLVCGFVITLLLASAQIGYAETVKTPIAKAPKEQEQLSPAAVALTGKVLQTMNSGGYTYVEIDNKGTKIWVAISEAEITKGETVSFEPGAVMENFKSKSLNRTFDKIIFSGGLLTPQSAAAAAAEPKPTGSKDKVVTTKEKIKVKKATTANSYSIAELYKNRAELDNKTVTVRGKVVKVSPDIMQRNWIHLQDGTGDAQKGTHNLVLTSTAEYIPATGDIVTATGTFVKDRDFGAGYKYDAIIENTTFVKK